VDRSRRLHGASESRSPHGERGLELVSLRIVGLGDHVAPHTWGAWIETISAGIRSVFAATAPFEDTPVLLCPILYRVAASMGLY
jgi:hypothetical protein